LLVPAVQKFFDLSCATQTGTNVEFGHLPNCAFVYCGTVPIGVPFAALKKSSSGAEF
jgi:hypothetical protein